ncbi:MAG: tetratricopeptide repeat protein [Planctomycetota bacterium]
MEALRAETFLEAVKPALRRGDAEALSQTVRERWVPKQLCPLLRHTDAEVRRAAAVALGMVGDRSVVGCLVRCLGDADERVHRDAEDALWSVWFRGSGPGAGERFRRGVLALTDDRLAEAIEHFNAALDLDHEFAEAYNQLAIAHYLAGEWRASTAACRQALALMPSHFGALAGMGHCQAHLGRADEAKACYRRALTINPRMPAIRSALARLESQAETSGGDSPTEADDTTLLNFPPDSRRSA